MRRRSLFYGGQEPTWNNQTVRAILRKYATGANVAGWVDIHTGLGPYGHGEKIYIGSNDSAEVDRGRAWWGRDVVVPHAGESVTPGVTGSVLLTIFDEAPRAEVAMIGLEFGTRPQTEVLATLRGLAWPESNPDASSEKASDIKQAARENFYCDEKAWKCMVWGQTKVVLLQSLLALAAE